MHLNHFSEFIRGEVCLSVCKTGFHLHAVSVEEANVGEIVWVGPVAQAQQQLPVHTSQTVDCLVKVVLSMAVGAGGFLRYGDAVIRN